MNAPLSQINKVKSEKVFHNQENLNKSNNFKLFGKLIFKIYPQKIENKENQLVENN